MNENLNKARCILESGGHTCVLCKDDALLTDDRRGIRPLLELYRSGRNLRGFSAADKVVGKAAAFLYLLMGIHAVHAWVISTPAKKVLADGGITVSYGSEVSAIQNRAGTGLCPMETAVWELDDPNAAPSAIENALLKL